MPLEQALYGHPDAGTLWEVKSHDHLEKQGFKKLESSSSLFWHEDLKLLLMVYVDDFRMAGPSRRMQQLPRPFLHQARICHLLSRGAASFRLPMPLRSQTLRWLPPPPSRRRARRASAS